MRLLTLLALLVSTKIAFAEPYVFPELYPHQSQPCQRSESEETSLSLTKADGSPQQHAVHSAIDLNKDGVCELLVTPEIDGADASEKQYHIYHLNSGELKELGKTHARITSLWLGEEANGYARLFMHTVVGESFNPVVTLSIMSYNGERYVLEHVGSDSFGHMQDQAMKAYTAKDYELSYQWYLNAYRFHEEKLLRDANNVALALIKLHRCDEATALLKKHLASPSEGDDKYRNAAEFNLGLCRNLN